MKSSPYQVVMVKKYHWKEICHPNINRLSATSKLFISKSFNSFQPLAVSLPKSSQLVKKSLKKPSDMKAMPQSPALLQPLLKDRHVTLAWFQPLGLPEMQLQNQPDSSALLDCILSHWKKLSLRKQTSKYQQSSSHSFRAGD